MVSRRKSIETLQEGTVLNAPQIVPGRNPRMNVPTVKASNVELNVFEPAIPMAEVHEELDEAKLLSEINEHMKIILDPYGRTTGERPSSVEALALSVMKIVYEYNVPTDNIFKGNEPANMSKMGNLIDLEQVVSRIRTATTVEASSVEVNVFKPAIPMATVYADQDEAQLLSEINEHMAILLDPYGRTTGVRTSPVEALALIMVMIVDETDLPVDGIVTGNEPTIMSEMGILMDLGQVVSRCTPSTTITASTVRASGVVTNPNAMSTV
jgi:hypothetical protein